MNRIGTYDGKDVRSVDDLDLMQVVVAGDEARVALARRRSRLWSRGVGRKGSSPRWYRQVFLSVALLLPAGLAATSVASTRLPTVVVSTVVNRAVATRVREPAPITRRGYRIVFDDEFNTLNRGVWDDHIWYDDPPSPAWTNFQYVSAGVLHLRTSRNFVTSTGGSYPLNTVTTQRRGLKFRRGYFEARMRWTGGPGAWPGFWLMSYRHAANPTYPKINPYCRRNRLRAAKCYAAEADVFEGQGTEPHTLYGTLHRNSCACYGVRDHQSENNSQQVGADLTAGFHTYAMLWTDSRVAWYLDGGLLMSTPVYDSTGQPMFLVLQMWTGGWTSEPTAATAEVLETQIDWVHVWQSSRIVSGKSPRR